MESVLTVVLESFLITDVTVEFGTEERKMKTAIIPFNLSAASYTPITNVACKVTIKSGYE